MRIILIIVLVSAAPAVVTGSQSKPAALLQCQTVPGLADLALTPGTVLLVGEIHGTQEVPAAVLDAACELSRAGKPLTIGLEVPHQEAARVSAYLGSDGSDEARRLLLSGPFWRRRMQDGRSSQAMMDLIEGLRRLAAEERSITVTLFDEQELPQETSRDRAMAERLAAAVASRTDTVVLVLTGNLHASTAPGTRWDADFQPMGYYLVQLLPGHRILSLDLSSTGGSVWICTSARASDCGEQKLAGHGEGSERRIVIAAEPRTDGFHGILHVGAVTASPPAAVEPIPGTSNCRLVKPRRRTCEDHPKKSEAAKEK